MLSKSMLIEIMEYYSTDFTFVSFDMYMHIILFKNKISNILVVLYMVMPNKVLSFWICIVKCLTHFSYVTKFSNL